MKKPARKAPPPAARSFDRLEQVRILAHPLRLQLLELFAEAPRTTKQAADRLGLPPTRLYHHVAALERVGLVRVKETRPNRGTIEKHYEAIARGFSADPADLVGKGKGAPGRRAAERLAMEGATALALRVIERARDELLVALDGRDVADDDPNGPLAMRAGIVGRPEDVAALRAELLGVIESWGKRDRKKRPDGGETVRAWLTLVWAPEKG